MNEITALKNYRSWKLKEAGFSEGEIKARMAAVNWDDEIDREATLRRANSSKHQDIWHKQQRERDKEIEDNLRMEMQKKREELKGVWPAKQILKLISYVSKNSYNRDFVVNDDNLKLIKAICYRLSEDERYVTELGFSFEKGLLIRGVCGLGKTFVVQCAKDNPLNPVHMVSMIEIAAEVLDTGDYTIATDGRKIIYIDDVGSEEEVNYYGTKINWFKSFLEKAYFNKMNYGNLMLSTNYNATLIEQKYGFRLRDRIKDMFNVLDVEGESFRGK